MFVFEGKSKYSEIYESSFLNNWKEQICIVKNGNRSIKLPLLLYVCYYWRLQTFQFVLLYWQPCVILSDCIISNRVIWRYITFHNHVLRLVMLRYITRCHIIVLNVLVWIFSEPSTAFGDKHSLGSTKRTERNDFFYFVFVLPVATSFKKHSNVCIGLELWAGFVNKNKCMYLCQNFTALTSVCLHVCLRNSHKFTKKTQYGIARKIL